MKDMVTRCPACGTSFRITEAQLQTAKGAVRCGSCLHIFKALDHLVEKGPKTAPPTGGKRPKKARPAAARKSAPAKPRAKPRTPTKPASPPAAAKAAAAATAKRQPKHKGLKFDQSAIDSETVGQGIALDNIDDDMLISDDMDLLDTAKENSSGSDLDGTLSDSFLELEDWKPEKKSLFDREISVTESQSADTADESWAIDLLEELEDEEKGAKLNAGNAADSDPYAQELLDTDRFSDDFNQSNDSAFSADTFDSGDDVRKHEAVEDAVDDDDYRHEPRFNLVDDSDGDSGQSQAHFERPAVSLRAHQSERAALLSGIEPAPVEMAWDTGSRLWGANRRWGVLAGGAALLLLLQLSWLQFDHLSRIEPYRGWYGVICSVFGCQLPDLLDPEQISAYNLVVRSHPRAENALVVDTILLNKAPFEQPFPKLTLSFSRLEGTPLASRTFTPEEYLGGELAGQTHMPTGQPVHLSLEIVDPGRDAVNYRIAIVH